MKRIGILTAGGDTPAMNATIHGAVVRANQLKVEIFGLIKGFNSLAQFSPTPFFVERASLARPWSADLLASTNPGHSPPILV